MQTILIIGASRGLGLEFVKQYLAEGHKVIATARKQTDVNALTKLGAQGVRVNVTSPDDFVALKKVIARKTIDVAIYNAGVFGPSTTGVEAVDRADFDKVMRSNVWGAMHAVPAVAPIVAKSKGVFMFVSSTMGSMAKMASTHAVTYRSSKAALNGVVKIASMQWGPEGATCFVMHPGWVKTDMGGPNADIDAHTSISGMRNVIAAAAAKPAKYNGGFFDYAGESLPW
jgi:NAD(P)-dependent dehydrogenase (short-subunit alcohol dehydrogenase family)